MAIEKEQRRAERFVESKYGGHSSVSEMHDELGWPPLSNETGGQMNYFLQHYQQFGRSALRRRPY